MVGGNVERKNTYPYLGRFFFLLIFFWLGFGGRGVVFVFDLALQMFCSCVVQLITFIPWIIVGIVFNF